MEHDSVEESLIAHTEVEHLSGENQYYCEGCQSKVDALKVTRFEALPPILTISLSRFYFDPKSMQSVKLEKMCSFPFILDMNDFLVDKVHKHTKYDLFSVVLHVGGSTGGGHYHAYIKDPYGTVVEKTKDSASASELNANNKCLSSIISSPAQRTESPLDNNDTAACLRLNHGSEYLTLAHGERPQTSSFQESYFDAPSGRLQKAGGGDHVIQHATMESQLPSSRTKGAYTNRLLTTPLVAADKPNSRLASQSCQKASQPLVFLNSQNSRKSQGREEDWTPDIDNGAVNPLTATTPDESNAQILGQANSSPFSSVWDMSDLLRQSLVIDTSDGRQKQPQSKPFLGQMQQRSPQARICRSKPRRTNAQPTMTAPPIAKHIPIDKRITCAISVCQVKPNITSKVVPERPHSARASVINTKPLGGCESISHSAKHNVKRPSVSPHASRMLSRPRRMKTHVSRIGYTLRDNRAGGFAVVTADGRNNSSRQRISSTSSSSSATRPPINRRPAASGQSCGIQVTSIQATNMKWRSKLFEGTDNTDSVKEMHNSPISHVADPRTVRTTRTTHTTSYLKYPEEPPPAYDSLSAVPPVSRSNAHCPSHSTTSNEPGIDPPLVAVCSRTLSSSTSHSRAEEHSSSGNMISKQYTGEDTTVDSSTIKQNPTDARHENTRRSTASLEVRSEVLVGRWFDFNDEYIAEVDPATFSRVFEGPECAYMLFYRLISLPLPVNLRP